jgi:hypothetical protein
MKAQLSKPFLLKGNLCSLSCSIMTFQLHRDNNFKASQNQWCKISIKRLLLMCIIILICNALHNCNPNIYISCCLTKIFNLWIKCFKSFALHTGCSTLWYKYSIFNIFIFRSFSDFIKISTDYKKKSWTFSSSWKTHSNKKIIVIVACNSRVFNYVMLKILIT